MERRRREIPPLFPWVVALSLRLSDGRWGEMASPPARYGSRSFGFPSSPRVYKASLSLSLDLALVCSVSLMCWDHFPLSPLLFCITVIYQNPRVWGFIAWSVPFWCWLSPFWCWIGAALVFVLLAAALIISPLLCLLSSGKLSTLSKFSVLVLWEIEFFGLLRVVDFPGKPLHWPCCRALWPVPCAVVLAVCLLLTCCLVSVLLVWCCFAGLLVALSVLFGWFIVVTVWLGYCVSVLTCEVLVPVVPAQHTAGTVLILCVYQPLNWQGPFCELLKV